MHARSLAPTLLGLSLLLGAAPAGAASGPRGLSGTVGWKVTVTTDSDDGAGTTRRGTATTQVSLKVRMTRRSGTPTWQVDDNGSSYTASYARDSTTEERDVSGALTCTRTAHIAASAGGPLPKHPKTTTAPVLLSSVFGGSASGGGALLLTPILNYSGELTSTDAGAGISPCQSGSDTSTEKGSLMPSNDARHLCIPAGTKGASTFTKIAGTVVGAWKAGSRKYSFGCTNSWIDGSGDRVVQVFTGALKAR